MRIKQLAPIFSGSCGGAGEGPFVRPVSHLAGEAADKQSVPFIRWVRHAKAARQAVWSTVELPSNEVAFIPHAEGSCCRHQS
jgi:hypothetical protein